MPPAEAWRACTDPRDVTRWNQAGSDRHCPSAEVDPRVGGAHRARMEARDGSFGFDSAGVCEVVDPPRALTLRLDDGRRSRTTFEPAEGGTRVTTVFDPEGANPLERQRDGWHAILDGYAAHVARGT